MGVGIVLLLRTHRPYSKLTSMLLLKVAACCVLVVAAVSAECEDKNDGCVDWAKRGECTNNPEWMKDNCALSCEQCGGPDPNPDCKDKNDGCAAWAKSGECEKNPIWMKDNCALSCDQCDGPNPTKDPNPDPNPTPDPNPDPYPDYCVDKDKEGKCDYYKGQGFCTRPDLKDWIKTACRKTCDMCKWEGWCAQGADHTMCRYKGVNQAVCTGLYDRDSLTPDQIQKFLDVHNELRRKIASGNQPGFPAARKPMPDLKWDKDLATVAQRWMDQCGFGHDTNRVVEHFPDYVGQNIYMFPHPESGKSPRKDRWRKTVELWYSEYKDFFPACSLTNYHMNCAYVGHFTQVVWQKTTHVGCGFTSFMHGGYPTTYVGCNYGPGGNFDNQPVYE